MYAAFHSVLLHNDPILVALEKVAKAGYDGLELNAETLPWATPHVGPDTSGEERRKLVAAAREANLRLPAIGAHIDMLGGGDQARAGAADFVKGCVDLAVDVQCPVVHILSGKQPDDMSRATAMGRFADAVEAVTDYAVSRGVALGIEAIAGMLFHSIDDYAELGSMLPGTDFRINFDPSHLFVQGEDPLELVKNHGDRICHMHIKDGAGRYPEFSFPPLGQGGIEFAPLISALQEIGYAGALSIEYEAQVFGYQEAEPDILRRSREFLHQFGI